MRSQRVRSCARMLTRSASFRDSPQSRGRPVSTCSRTIPRLETSNQGAIKVIATCSLVTRWVYSDPYWGALGAGLSSPTIPTLVSIVNSGTTATVTIKSPPGTIKPGGCPGFDGCGDANANRVTIAGALGQTALNGSYVFSNAACVPSNAVWPCPPDANGVVTTTFKLRPRTCRMEHTAKNLSPCATCFNEPQLGVGYLGPTSNSGQSDFGGGGDSIVTLGLWAFDDIAGCQADPSLPARTIAITRLAQSRSNRYLRS